MAAAAALNRRLSRLQRDRAAAPRSARRRARGVRSAGNPSSIHAEGRAARAIVEEARRAVARLAGVPRPLRSSFVSGGTEAANLALTPAFGAGPDAAPLERLIVAAGEHPCVLRGHRFRARGGAACAATGRIDLAALEAASPPAGARAAGAPGRQQRDRRHAAGRRGGGAGPCGGRRSSSATRCSSPAGSICAIAALGADFLILSAHKFGGPKGAGALIATRAELSLGAPLLRGGGQERGVRAGTENVAAIAGFRRRGAARRRRGGRARRRGSLALRDRLDRRRAARVAPDAVDLRRGRAAPAQHLLLRRARHRRGDAADRPRSRRRRGLVRLGLFVRQGRALACAGGDGGRPRSSPRRDPAQPRLGLDAKPTSSASPRPSPALCRMRAARRAPPNDERAGGRTTCFAARAV